MLVDDKCLATTQLLQRIDHSLTRMERKGFADTEHYKRLKQKRDAIAMGASYTVRDVTRECIAAFGALICTTQMFAQRKYYSINDLAKQVHDSVYRWYEN